MVEFIPKRQKLMPTVKFKCCPKSFESRTICDFWKWAYSDLMQNIERAVLAEYIVAVLLDVDKNPRVPWLSYDLKLPDGKKVEVKTMSRLQAWYQKELSNPRVVIKPTRKWDPETSVMDDVSKFHSDLYVICFFTAESHETADPLNLTQWEFYTFTQGQIKKVLKESKSISLKLLERLGIEPITAHELKNKVMQLCKLT